MGLDIIELVLEVEETFCLRIPDEEAARIRTVGDLIDFVSADLNLHQTAVCPTSRAFYQLRRERAPALGLARHDLRPALPPDPLIPRPRRRQVWRDLLPACHAAASFLFSLAST